MISRQNSTAPAVQGPQQEQSTVVPPANIIVVTSAAGLQEAVTAGAADIEIRSHLDLGQLNRLPIPDLVNQREAEDHEHIALMYVTNYPRSIRGNCSDPDAAAALGLSAADAAELLPLKPFQCMLLMHDSWLVVAQGAVWVDNVYLRRTAVTAGDFVFISSLPHSVFTEPPAPPAGRQRQQADSASVRIFVTNSTLQAGRGAAGGVSSVAIPYDHQWPPSLHVEDCVFSDWSGFASPLTVTYSAVADVVDTVFRNMRLAVELADVSFGGTVRFRNVSLADVELEHGAVVSTTLNDYMTDHYFHLTFYPEDDAAYDVEVETVPVAQRGAFGEQLTIANATMSDCMNADTYAYKNPELPGCPAAAAEARRRRYEGHGDADAWSVSTHGGRFNVDLRSAAWNEERLTLRRELLDEGVSWLTALKAVLPPNQPPPDDWPPFVAPPPLPPPPQTPPLHPTLSAGGTPPAPQRAPTAPQPAAPHACLRGGCAAGIAAAVIALCALAGLWLFWRRRRRRAARRALYMKHVELSEGGAMPGVGCSAISGQCAGDPRPLQQQQQRRVAKVMRQLDAYRTGGELLLGRLELLPRAACLLGGQTVVQPALNTKDGSKHVVKFFLSEAAFCTEAAILAAFMPALRAHLRPDLAAAAAAARARAAPDVDASTFLPQVEKVVDNTSGRLRGAGGGRLPSLLVMGRAQSLQEWSAAAAPDIFSSIAMLSNVAHRLACLHDAGYVHCALKPSKILMSATRRWAISGFAGAARAGTDVPLSFTLAYAAPEVVLAIMRGQRSIEAAPALDAWALGVIAFEALTGGLAFDLVTAGTAQVVAQVAGERLLPWEGPRSGRPLERLGMLRGAVMHLLERNPAQRATPRQFLTACGAAFPQHVGPGL